MTFEKNVKNEEKFEKDNVMKSCVKEKMKMRNKNEVELISAV